MRRKVVLQAYVTPEQGGKLKALSALTKVPVAEYVRHAIDLFFEKGAGDTPTQLLRELEDAIYEVRALRDESRDMSISDAERERIVALWKEAVKKEDRLLYAASMRAADRAREKENG